MAAGCAEADGYEVRTKALLAEKESGWQRSASAPRILTQIPLRGNGETKWQREAQKIKELSVRVHLQSKLGMRKRELQKPGVGREGSGKRRAKIVLRWSQVQELEKPVC